MAYKAVSVWAKLCWTEQTLGYQLYPAVSGRKPQSLKVIQKLLK